MESMYKSLISWWKNVYLTIFIIIWRRRRRKETKLTCRSLTSLAILFVCIRTANIDIPCGGKLRFVHSSMQWPSDITLFCSGGMMCLQLGSMPAHFISFHLYFILFIWSCTPLDWNEMELIWLWLLLLLLLITHIRCMVIFNKTAADSSNSSKNRKKFQYNKLLPMMMMMAMTRWHNSRQDTNMCKMPMGANG